MLFEAFGLLVMFLILGAIWAFLDTKIGVPIRRWWYGMTHKGSLPENDKRGMIVGQPAKKKLVAATIISTIQSIWTIYEAGGNINFLQELILWFFEAGFMMVGFYMVTPFIKTGEFLLEKVAPNFDRIERGEVSVGGLAGEVAGAAASGVTSAAGSVVRDVAGRVEEGVDDVRKRLSSRSEGLEDETEEVIELEIVVEPEPEPEPKEPRPDPKDVFEKFKRRKD